MKRAAGVFSVIFVVIWAHTAWAQTVGSSLQGRITDPTGAVVPRAQVEVRNAGTGSSSKAESDEAGRFRAGRSTTWIIHGPCGRLSGPAGPTVNSRRF